MGGENVPADSGPPDSGITINRVRSGAKCSRKVQRSSKMVSTRAHLVLIAYKRSGHGLRLFLSHPEDYNDGVPAVDRYERASPIAGVAANERRNTNFASVA